VRDARSGSAPFTFALKAVPSDSVRFEIADQSGAVIRRMAYPGRAGVSRVTWDLHGDSPDQPALRTIAPDNPRIWEEPRFKDRSTRPVIHWGIDQPQRAGILYPPGAYSVRMTVNGKTYSQPFEVLKNPVLRSTAEDLVANTSTQKRVVGDIDQSVEMINQLESVRKQIEDRAKVAGVSASVVKALKQLDAQALSVELQLLSRSDLNSDDKWYVEKYKVYLNLVWLYGEVGTGAGDVAGGADYRPTDVELQSLSTIETDLAKAKQDFASFMQKALTDYNNSAAGKVAPVQPPGRSIM
jgi:hypothetical protein